MAPEATSPRPYRLAAVFVFVAAALVPWTAAVGATLPPQHVAQHWDVAWTGFDILLIGSLLGTAIATAYRSAWLPALAAISGTLLLCDAWFDTLTASGSEVWTAVGLAALAEIPLAAVCFVLAARATHPLRNR